MPRAKTGDVQDLNTVKIDTSVESPNELRSAMDWVILFHKLHNEKDNKGEVVKLVVPNAHDIAGYHIRFRIKWTMDPPSKAATEKKWKEGFFIERDVQYIDEKKVLAYWAAVGGRDSASGIPDDWAHVLRILEKRQGKKGQTEYKLQFVGYSAEESEEWWWTEKELKYNYPKLLEEWEARDG
ncbi:hypothetical protein ACHAPT_002215 [Fusarium lateritium]